MASNIHSTVEPRSNDCKEIIKSSMKHLFDDSHATNRHMQEAMNYLLFCLIVWSTPIHVQGENSYRNDSRLHLRVAAVDDDVPEFDLYAAHRRMSWKWLPFAPVSDEFGSWFYIIIFPTTILCLLGEQFFPHRVCGHCRRAPVDIYCTINLALRGRNTHTHTHTLGWWDCIRLSRIPAAITGCARGSSENVDNWRIWRLMNLFAH